MKHVLLPAGLIVVCACALAKLPPPDDAAKAKAAEAAAKAAWQAKVDAFQLCKAQDKVAAAYRKSAGAGASRQTPAPAAAPAAATSQAAASAPQPAASGTPVASKPPPPCADPGPFAYNPPEQKPLETSEAHSPAGTAANPPSNRSTSAEMAPAKK